MLSMWLASALMAAATGCDAQWHHGSPWLIDADADDVTQILGDPSSLQRVKGKSVWIRYVEVDWMGGREERSIFADGNEIVVRDESLYEPFVSEPPWLAALRNDLAPAGK